MNGRENDYCFNRTFVNVFDFFFFISTSVQRQGVTDDFLKLVPPHPFTGAFFSFLCLFFLRFLLSLSLSSSFALSLHQHTTNDIIIWAFHSLLALSLNYMCAHYCACTSNSIYLSSLVLYVYNSNS